MVAGAAAVVVLLLLPLQLQHLFICSIIVVGVEDINKYNI